jgi:alpha-L-fucosidase 2
MRIKSSVVINLLGVLFFSCHHEKIETGNNERLWYTYPAKYWNSQALHLGNGYLGASFFGGADEILAISEKSMWTGSPAEGRWDKAGVNPKALSSLPLIRAAVLENKSQHADSLITSNFLGSSELFGNFTSVGNLRIRFQGQEGEHSGYTRELDLSNSIGLVRYKVSNSNFRREYFCSYPDRVLAMKFISDNRASISLDLAMDILQDSSKIEISGCTYQVFGRINGNHRPFSVLIHVKNYGGTIGSEGDRLSIKGADSAEVYLAVATNYAMKYPHYKGEDPEKITKGIIDHSVSRGYETLKKRHITDYHALYDRVKFSVKGDKKVETLPTNERFLRLRSGKADPGYKTLLFNLGRYLIISSSRINTLPANLQGVWNVFLAAPWAGNYQSNINLQEIYWSCGPTNLAECQQAYIDWIDDLTLPGKEIAGRVYGTGGWVSHTTGNIWGHAAPIGGHPWGMYPMGAAWHCQHVWDQFAFTQDTQYLRKQAYPILKGASVFWLENLIPFNGYYITSPTVSAEHGALMTENGLNPAFHDSVSTKYNYSIPGVYQDIEMLWDLFTNTIEAAKIAGDKTFADTLLKVRSNLTPLKIGRYGQLQEWYQDIDNPQCHHRHIAHLYAVCPGHEINPLITPELAKAAARSLDMRGDGRYPDQELAAGGNWARAHRMWCWTRLLDGNRANKILTELITEEGFENGLTFQHAEYHWNRKDLFMEDSLYLHFQLDASASVPGCIAEMLVQSRTGEIYLLPALPDELNTGKVTGLKARGNYTIDLEWKNGVLLSADIWGTKNAPVPVIRYRNKIIDQTSSVKIRYRNK